ncbi:MAG: hypothetical protein RL151_879 [Bacteroidota bacterium]|jgi:hypothetical protein
MIPVIHRRFDACYLSDEFNIIMEERDDLSGFIRRINRLVREYAELRLGLMKLQAIRTISRLFSMLMVTLTGILMSIFVLFFLGLALSAWVADMTGSTVAGHLAAAGFFLVLLVLGILLRKPLFQAPLIRMFISATSEEPEELGEEDEESKS